MEDFKMKKALSLLLIMVLVTTFTWAKKDAKKAAPKKGAEVSNTAKGFKVDGDKVIFIFDPKDYPAGFEPPESAQVAGEFNGWDPGAADWKMELKNGVFYLETTKAKAPSGLKFKFVADNDWQQPDPDKAGKENLADDGYGGFNLILKY